MTEAKKVYSLDLGNTIVELDSDEMVKMRVMCDCEGWSILCNKLLHGLRESITEQTMTAVDDQANLFKSQGIYSVLKRISDLKENIKNVLDEDTKDNK